MSVVLCVNLIDRRRSRRNTAGAGLPLVRYTCTGWDPFGVGYYLCCKVDRSPGQKLAYTFQLVGAIYPLKLHINPAVIRGDLADAQ